MCCSSILSVRPRAAISIPERSDVDFFVKFHHEHPDALSLDTSFNEALEALFGPRVDLVEPDAVRNPYLNASVEASREAIFEVSC